MKSAPSQFTPNAEDDQRVARILFRVIGALLATYAVVIATALLWQDPLPILVTLASGVWLLAAMALLPRGHVTASGVMVVINVLITATLLATLGQGIHDIGITAFPAIIVISSLILSYRAFLTASLLTIGAVAWLVYGEMFGLYASRPIGPPGDTDFIIVVVILLVTIMTTTLLARNLRGSLYTARQENQRRQAVEAQLRHQSTHDALTGINNRSHFQAELEHMQQSAVYPVSIIVADVDNLKAINDTQGHALGDETLRRAANVLRSVFRSSDVLARIGGDEFAVLLPQTDAEMVNQMLSRIERRLAEFNAQNPDPVVQFSLGSSTAVQGKLAEALAVADQRMYENKAMRKMGRRHGPDQAPATDG